MTCHWRRFSQSFSLSKSQQRLNKMYLQQQIHLQIAFLIVSPKRMTPKINRLESSEFEAVARILVAKVVEATKN